MACFTILTACDNSPPPDYQKKELRIGEEVFRMFCMRAVRTAYPEDPNGLRFSPSCEGSEELPSDIAEDERAKTLVALVERREDTIAALDLVLGDELVDKAEGFGDDELREFTFKLLPFYSDDETGDASLDKLLPRSTQALAKVMARLSDENDEQAGEVRATIARIAQRVGYRAPDRVLAAVRPALTYDGIDELVESLLDLVANGGQGHDVFMQVLQAIALELAEPAEAKQNPTTLSLALKLVLEPSDLYVQAEAPKALEPLVVLRRDDEGNAIPVGDTNATPFPVAGRDDGSDRASVTALALSSGEDDGYETFDANRTALASLLRDSIPLIRRDGKPRSVVENALRAARPLLGKDKQRTEKFGDKTLTYNGPDIENGPMGKFLYSITTLLKLPQTKPLLQAVQKLLETDENSATQLIDVALAIDAKSDEAGFNGGKLTGPNEFWDDLIQMGQRIITEKPGLLQDILTATLAPETVATGKILGHQMSFKDLVKLQGDKNSDVTTGCPAESAYCVPVEREMSGADRGMNRSLFQRTLNLVHGTYKSPNCNKAGATLTVQKPVPTTFPNPPLGPLAPFIGGFSGGSGSCPASTIAPSPATTYTQCQVIEQKSGTVTLLQAMLEKAKIVIKDESITLCAKAVGSDVSKTQEEEAGITGFTQTPTPKALARFIYAERNKFLTDLFEPYPVENGVRAGAAGAGLDVVDYEPNGMYSLEVIDPQALVDNKPQSFMTASLPLLRAFDKYEKFDANGDVVGGYLFAELLDLVHMHYGSPSTEACPTDAVEKGVTEGCTQSADPSKAYYAYGTNIVSYEPLVAWAMIDQDLLGVLSRSAAALQAIKIDVEGGQKDGLVLLGEFLEAVLKSNPDIKYKDNRAYAKTNLCSGPDSSDPTVCACPAGSEPEADGVWCKSADGAYTRRGRIIAGGVPPLYVMLDALNELDEMWKTDAERHKIYLDVRSRLVDQLLLTTRSAEGTTSLKNRRAYALTRNALPWLLDRMTEHQSDLATWADGLVDRLAGVIAHPIAARGMDLFDKFWEDEAAGDRVAELLTYLLDESENPEAFTGAIIAAADTLTFFDKDPDLTPAIRFAALVLSEGALDAVNGGDDPEVDEGTAYRFLEVTRAIAKKDQGPQLSTLAKVLRNAALPLAGKLEGKSPIEVVIDLVADVNRLDPDKPTTETLDAADNLNVFKELNVFLTDPSVGLERLYQVIENREIK